MNCQPKKMVMMALTRGDAVLIKEIVKSANQESTTEGWMTIEEMARRTERKPATVRTWIRDGLVLCKFWGSVRMVKPKL